MFHTSRVALFGSVLALSFTSACATLSRGSTDVLLVNSTPRDVTVRTTKGMHCTGTPCSFTMPRRTDTTVYITKEGCRPVEVHVTSKISNGGGTALAGNLLIGGLGGVVVDSATGAGHDLTPNPINVTMECPNG